ncbi:hypothetical protein [Burkholderia vietnamiensis]|uniref:hypothetical protein n=1 Tax=Burkholderia vietnamiensis TaxID=60552 RepID=UPI001CF1938B|nr:hypothetical protein [Burkholderia vietnamiensis]MCA8448922.1 hypothetical protein [Burkholderia vietnamiensis]
MFKTITRALRAAQARANERAAPDRDAEAARLATVVAEAEAAKAKADQAVRDALANPLVGDATSH